MPAAEIIKILDTLKNTIKTEEGKRHLEKIEKARLEFLPVRQKVVELAQQNKNVEAVQIMDDELQPLQDKYIAEIADFIHYQSELLNDNSVDSINKAESTQMTLVILTLISLAIGIIIAWFITKSIVKPIKQSLEAAKKIADGDMDINLDTNRKDETGDLLKSMKVMAGSIKDLVLDANKLAQSAIDGKLDTRADATKHKGEYRHLVDGINATLDAVIGPLNVAAEYVDRISKGDIPSKITDKYNGDFNELKSNLNTCIDAVNNLVADSNSLAQAAIEGNLSARADATKHQGDFKSVVQGVNNTLDSITVPIKEAAKVIQQWAEGKLTYKVEGDYKGDHAYLKTAINTTVDMLPFKELNKVLNAMSEGDMTLKMTGDYKGDSLSLKNAVNDTIDSITEILLQIVTIGQQVTQGAIQVSDASGALSQGATEQAASLEEITSSMAEIGSQTKLNAENASQANFIAIQSRQAAEKGNTEMAQLNRAMGEINDSSKNISKIIKVIDEIAFQTNLLALNAAVEAARAGRHGKGFAVVAEEVRNLAARSAKAAKETAELIEGSIKTVEKGSNLAGKTADALDEITTSSTKVTDIVGEIATSSNEQAQGISQINIGLSQIDKVTQTNTASAEESASAAEELSGQANNLQDMLRRFKLKGMNFQGSHNDPRNLNASSGRKQKRLQESNQYNYEHLPLPSDSIKLDEDEFGRY